MVERQEKRMYAFFTSHGEQVRDIRLEQLVNSMESRRRPETCDVVLTSGNKNFFAHKVVLEASSPFFLTMFHSSFNEAKSSEILLTDIEPETLEIILDFIYLGEVNKMKTEEDVKRVLAQSHLMQIKDMFRYCCLALAAIITSDNYFEIWEIALTYEIEQLKENVMDYVNNNFSIVKDSGSFLLLPDGQLKDFVEFCKRKGGILDNVLEGLIMWLFHDLASREGVANELFACLDANLVTEVHMKSLLRNPDVMASSSEIADCMNELGVAVFLARYNRRVRSHPADDQVRPPEIKEMPTSVPERLEKFHLLHAEKAKKERWAQLTVSLSALRTAATSDVTLVCGHVEFHAHKVVLGGFSPYFGIMSNGEMEEPTCGKIMIHAMDSETLDTILQYAYLGELTKLQPEDKLKKVLAASHTLHIAELFGYCCDALEVAVSIANVFEVWQIGSRYEHKSLLNKVMYFVLNHFDVLKDSHNFCLLSLAQLQDLVKFSEGKVSCCDKILQVLVNWLIHDITNREMLAAELFACIDVQWVSKKCVKSLVRNAKIMKSSAEIAKRINELCISVWLSESCISANLPLLKLHTPIKIVAKSGFIE